MAAAWGLRLLVGGKMNHGWKRCQFDKYTGLHLFLIETRWLGSVEGFGGIQAWSKICHRDHQWFCWRFYISVTHGKETRFVELSILGDIVTDRSCCIDQQVPGAIDKCRNFRLRKPCIQSIAIICPWFQPTTSPSRELRYVLMSLLTTSFSTLGKWKQFESGKFGKRSEGPANHFISTTNENLERNGRLPIQEWVESTTGMIYIADTGLTGL